MKIRKIVIGTVLAIVSLSVVSVLIVVASIAVLDRTNGTIVSSGQKREYLLYVPSSYDRAKATSLVISMHGAAVWPAHQMNASRWNRLAESHGFIVVYPAGFHEGPRIWHVERGAGLMRDVRFISELIDTLEAAYNIDPTRIYANGFSNGGGMAFVLSCTLSDRIAAVGMAAAAQILPWSWCTDRRPVPIIAFHGTADPIVPYNGGLASSMFAPTRFAPNPEPYPSIPGWAENWARRNRCGMTPVDSAVAVDVTRRVYTHCADDAAVVLYTVQGGGHQWPGGKPMPAWMVGPASDAIDATTQMWAFFGEHRLREAPKAAGRK